MLVQNQYLEIRYQVIKDIFEDVYYREHKNEIVVFCPKKCKLTKKKLEINILKNTFHCWVCDYKGRIFSLLREYASESQKRTYFNTLGFEPITEDEKINKLELPEEYQFLLDKKNTIDGKEVLKILMNLEISFSSTLQNKIGFCTDGKYQNRIIFPSFSKTGELNYFTSRTFKNHSLKYLDCEIQKSDIIFNEIFIDWKRPVVIVEGVKSYLKHFELPVNIIPLLGSFLTENHKVFKEIILNDCNTVYIALDSEAKNKSAEVMHKLHSFSVDVRFVDMYPYNQPDEVDKNFFWKCIQTAKPFDKNDYLENKILEI